jgi:SAM-dependent methyltransferase
MASPFLMDGIDVACLQKTASLRPGRSHSDHHARPWFSDCMSRRMSGHMQQRVEAYWNQKPCDSEFSARSEHSAEFFLEVERERYRLQTHIPPLLDAIDWAGKRVLEIGTGVGTDARRIVARGGIYTGINIDAGSTRATAMALEVFRLPGQVLQCDTTRMHFPDESFDFIYTFGVLHHIPDAPCAMREIMRVLKPGGELLAMLYNRDSINYAVEIKILRRLGMQLLRIPRAVDLLATLGLPRAKLLRHRELARAGWRMSEDEWLSRNTDGPDNPYSRVYDEAQAAALFAGFHIKRQQVFYFNHEHWGALGRALPRNVVEALGRRWGWHRIVQARKPTHRARMRRR